MNISRDRNDAETLFGEINEDFFSNKYQKRDLYQGNSIYFFSRKIRFNILLCRGNEVANGLLRA